MKLYNGHCAYCGTESWIVTLDVLKYALPDLLCNALSRWIVTLDVLKWRNKEIKNRTGQVE